MEKIIFLDFDGVVNNHRTFMLFDHNIKIDIFCLDLIKEIVVKHNLKIVISSSWRTLGLDFIKDKFNRVNRVDFLNFLHDDWCTKNLSGKRGFEIEEWLKRHESIEKFICIDDDSDFLESQPLLLIDRSVGFQNIDQIILDNFFSSSLNERQIKFGIRDLIEIKNVVEHKIKFIESNLGEGF